MNMLHSTGFWVALFGVAILVALHLNFRWSQHILVTETESFLREVSGDRK